MKYADKKFSKSVDVHRNCESDNFDEIHKVSSTLKNKKLKINKVLNEIYKDIIKNPIFEQKNFSSRTAKGIYKIGHDSIRLMKWICFYDRSY